VKLRNEFTIDAPVEKAWPVLLDIGRVASCLPGAVVEPADGDGVFRGTMKVKLGPLVTTYQGTARLQDVDEDTRTASVSVQAREQKGQGAAAAVITNRLERAGDGTRVVAETDLSITGRQAQFGRGIMEDVAGRMLADFAQRFERELLADPGDAPAGAEHAVPAGGATPATNDFPEPGEVLDVGRVFAGGPLPRAAGVGVLAAVALAIAGLVARRRRGPMIELRYRW
jgi:carbon monoxide dehydrogenase subunit G